MLGKGRFSPTSAFINNKVYVVVVNIYVVVNTIRRRAWPGWHPSRENSNTDRVALVSIPALQAN